MKIKISLIATTVCILMDAFVAHAAVTAEQAARLNSDLTPVGAERAGNSDGSIPAWTGGYTKADPHFQPGQPGSRRLDYFANDKILYVVTSSNRDQYDAILTDGVKGLFAKHPDFEMQVYPTHRSAAMPDWVYENTEKNATTAQLVNDGFGVENAKGGIPFPIPQNAYEVMWNHQLHWRGLKSHYTTQCWLATPNGKVRLSSSGEIKSISPYYLSEAGLEGYHNVGWYIQDAPPSKAGESIMTKDSLNDEKYPRGLWQYLVGQRRVRRAPTVAYDTPDTITSGISFVDEAFLQFGPWDHHTYKLLGKREILIPYNNNKAAASQPEELMGKYFLNPDLVRWELHRVWVMEATLAPGKRHVVKRRRYYIDEDTWQIILLDGWDAHDNLWRMSYSLTLLTPDVPALQAGFMWGAYNLQEGGYFVNSASIGKDAIQVWEDPSIKSSMFTPEELANMGTR